jgi:uncharacterized protein (DUF362 family)/Pyruvate/2-oxoacid:ferredoxin oxidoreductase delta subunit
MIHPAEYEDCQRAVARALELFPLDVRGKRVLVKPNALRRSKAEEGIATHPALLRAVVDRLEAQRPAAIVVGDNPGVMSYGANEATFRETGLMDAAKGYYRNIGNRAVEVDFNKEFAATVGISQAVREADLIISLPKFKTHGLTVLTGAIKNSYGFLPGAQKARLHREAGSPARFHEVVVDVFGLRVPDLFIVDAVVGMEGNGPASRDLRHIGRVLASDNGVALDATMARMMGLEPGRLGFLARAQQRGLGPLGEEEISVLGELEPIPDFRLPALGGAAIAGNPAAQEALLQRTRLRPQADPALCTGCGTCADQCPARALSMVHDLPVVDPQACIVCFCCQEICPERAMALR